MVELYTKLGHHEDGPPYCGIPEQVVFTDYEYKGTLI